MTTTKEIQERDEKLKVMGMIIKHNGHVAYQMFTQQPLTHEIQIDAIDWPLGAMPTSVAFKNADLIGTLSSNDVDNPDGSEAPKVLEPMAMPAPPAAPIPVKKTNHLKRIK